MSFKFLQDDDSVSDGFRRIAREQLGKAIAECGDAAMPAAERILAARKRCKKLRGLLRLVGPSFPEHGDEDAAIRAAASALSGARDGDMLIGTLDDLDTATSEPAAASVRAELERRHREPQAETGLALAAFAEALRAIDARTADWTLEDRGFKAISGGLAKTYRSARKAMATAEAEGTSERFHGWRRHVKYHWHHLGLVREIAPDVLGATRTTAQKLAGVLGAHHDLAVLAEALAADETAFGEATEVYRVVARATDRQQLLAQEALVLGHELFAETPSALSRRLHEYWRSWRSDADRLAAMKEAETAT